MAEQLQSIQDALAVYDKAQDQDHIEAAERERQELLKRFPIEAWPALTLEQYALGQSDQADTYCRWLEFGTPHLGSMRGGSALKHLIYKHKNKPGWYYGTGYDNEHQAWESVRGAFLQAFELARAGNWEQIDELVPLSGGRALRLKTLHVYFPDEMLPISSIYHLRHFLQRLGVYTDEMRDWDVVRLNRRLLQELRAIPELRDWTTQEMERFLYSWADPRETRRIVKIAPGDDAKYWDDCLANGYICVGWDGVGDLREFESEDAFRERFTEAYTELYKGHKPTLTRKANELWTLTGLEPGDLVVANKGISVILGVGEVIEPGYEWRPDRAEYRHTVRIKWDTGYAKEIAPRKKWGTVTVDPIPLELSRIILTKHDPIIDPFPTLIEPFFLEVADALERKGQVILYGPPGTGKTFQARRFAVWWLLNHQGDGNAWSVLTDSQALIEAERRLSADRAARRVWWVVANPKEWSWEQLFQKKREVFRYGRLQRNYPLVQPGDLVLGYQSAPDKRLVALARVSKGMNDVSGDGVGFEIVALQRIANGLTYQELQADPMLKNMEPLRHRCQGTLFALTPDEAEYLLALLSERDASLSDYMPGDADVTALTWVTFHPSYSYEDFIEGFRPVDTGGGGLVLRLEDGLFKRICRHAQARPNHRYLLVVDEINRANIAKVFGELITLLEKDKRGLVVTLPQSKESFTIPLNVYLLGTMNTADRSIKLLDAALRRRFAFLEIMPDVDQLHGAMVSTLALDDFLAALNRRIAATEGREKQIGHAYLLDDGQPISEPSEFARRFRQEILPLLQEYCYDDYAALASYLGDTLVDSQAQTLNAEVLNDPDRLIEALTQMVNSENMA
ncbi:MAG: EVE domain-containing protein [Thermoflexales bacterium]|nr:EVE domain-containing protein [Thermoflexales bacterium]